MELFINCPCFPPPLGLGCAYDSKAFLLYEGCLLLTVSQVVTLGNIRQLSRRSSLWSGDFQESYNASVLHVFVCISSSRYLFTN
jgi:hypothetical protein